MNKVNFQMPIMPQCLMPQFPKQIGHFLLEETQNKSYPFSRVYALSSWPINNKLHSHLVVLKPLLMLKALEEKIFQINTTGIRAFYFEHN